MVAEGFVAPELNPMHRLKVGEEKVIEEVDELFHVTMGHVRALKAQLIADLMNQWKQQVL
jgi:hypothetical protein